MGFQNSNPYSVGIDARMWNHAGIGRYISELTVELIKNNSDYRLAFFGGRNILESINASALKEVDLCQTNSGIYGLGEQLEMASKAKAVDLLHVPHFNIPVLFQKPLVVTIHDLIYLHYPEVAKSPLAKAYTTFLFKQIQEKASAIITVSEFTKRDLLGKFPRLSADQVFVTYEAVGPSFRRIRDDAGLELMRQEKELHRPFILFVGSFKAHKNISTLIKAVARLRQTRDLNHELVLVGRRDGRDKELEGLIRKYSFVRCLGQLSDAEMVYIYNLASVFVLPSFIEGFGLPLLEAMACGTAVVASERASLPEVAGEAADYFDPDQSEELENILYTVLTNISHRDRMIQRGFLQVKKFSWEKTALQTLEVYRSVLS